MWTVELCVVVWLYLTGPGKCAVPSGVLVNYTRPGDFIIGGIFPLHQDNTCEAGMRSHILERVQTMVFAMEEINANYNILPNVTLGFDIRESCYMEDAALWSALSILSGHVPDGMHAVTTANAPRSRLVGIVGTSRSSTSIVAAKATNLYQVPMISGYATSDELSDKGRFPYFLRTAPPDKLQALAIIDALLRFEWRYIGVMYSIDTYGIRGTQELLNLADESGICVAFSIAVRKTATESEIQEAVSKILEFDKAKVYVMFGGYEGMYRILQEYHRIKPAEKLTLVGSDAFAYFEEHGLQNMSLGNLFFTLNFHQVPGFDRYFNELVATSMENPWFVEYKDLWKSELGCTDFNNCYIRTSNRSSPAYHAVYAFAYALDNMMHAYCGVSFANADCELFQNGISGPEFLPFLLNVTFEGIDGLFRFDENGDPEGTYNINSFRNGEYYRVGSWDSRGTDRQFSINKWDIHWPDGVGKPPSSLCVEHCRPGYIVVPLDKKCCKGCHKCASNAIVRGGACRPCEERFWPDEVTFTECREIEASTFAIDEVSILVILALSLIGICFSSLSFAGMTYYRNHPLIKATSRELSFLSILGTVLAFFILFAFLPRPTAVSCAISEAILSLCVTLTYAPTLLKVNRIFRIFDSSKRSTKPPRFVRPKDQLILSAGLISVQIIIVIISVVASPSKPEYLIPTPLEKYVEIYCQFGSGFIASCVYNLLLILACCYYAFKARKVPSNYNESKFIAVSVYSTLVLCLAAVPVYTTAVAVLQKVATLCVALLLNAYLTLVCVYLPKFYAARFVEDVRVMDWSSSIQDFRVKPASTVSTSADQPATVS
ncbi:metabotropic glutamate receptor-like [Acanthaster planci]|uniref:Metabotropic glutamate receptor-like n=1 Tax=Acanthaster planci TaxID=133434 RepID=A0A8B7ZMU6_ACAPL|nr:metabotropic glutamate receptor-like [Acanthaster planci]